MSTLSVYTLLHNTATHWTFHLKAMVALASTAKQLGRAQTSKSPLKVDTVDKVSRKSPFKGKVRSV